MRSNSIEFLQAILRITSFSVQAAQLLSQTPFCQLSTLSLEDKLSSPEQTDNWGTMLKLYCPVCWLSVGISYTSWYICFALKQNDRARREFTSVYLTVFAGADIQHLLMQWPWELQTYSDRSGVNTAGHHQWAYKGVLSHGRGMCSILYIY